MDGAASLPARHGDGMICPLPLALRGLADRPHWVIWRWTDPVPGRKPDKPLYRAADPWRHASTQDPASWDSFAAAMGAIAAGEADGAGYVLRDDADHLFLDLDDCRDPASGALAGWAERLVEEADSYTEVTPSGRGLRIIGMNEGLSAPIHRRVAMPEGGSVEIFHRCPRYVTVSGQRLAGTPDRLRPICDLAADLLLLAQPDTPGASQPQGSAPPRHNPDAAARPEDIAAALAGIPNPDLPWEEWSRIGMAVWRASAGSPEGLAAWRAWSAKSGKHRDAACDERWRHWFRSPPGRIGFGSLHHMAQQANPLWVKPSLLSPVFPAAARQTGAEAVSTDWEGDRRQPDFARPSGAQNPPTARLVATPFDPADLATLGPREWVYGQFLIRRFVSVLGAPGGTGKTAYAVAVALSVALGRPLVEEPVHSPGPVWLYNLEDPRDELLRRVQAALIAHDIPPGDLQGRLYLDSGREQPLILATRLHDGSTVATPLVEALIAELTRRQVRLLIVDPFVKSHRLEENRNEQVDFAATLWSRVADAAGCAILLVHHFRKGGIAGDADAFRGASALIDAARAAVTLRTMSEEEAQRSGVEVERRKFFIRADNAKLNLAPQPMDALWLELRSVPLPSGDHVQAVARWQPSTVWKGLPHATILDLLRTLDAGRPSGDRWSPRKEAGEGWAGQVLMDVASLNEVQAKEVLRGWERSGLLRREPFRSESRKMRDGYVVDATKLAEMEREFGGRYG
jgi:hypothetical protein